MGPTHLPTLPTCLAIFTIAADSPNQGTADAASSPTFNNVCPATPNPLLPRCKSDAAIKLLLVIPKPSAPAAVYGDGTKAVTALNTSNPAA